MFKKKYQFPKHIKIEDDSLKLQGHLYLANRQIYLNDITSIRVYAVDTKATMMGIPNYRTVEQDITLRQKNGEDVVIYMKPLFKSFGFNPTKKGSTGDKKFSKVYDFIKFIEEKTIENRLSYYLDNQTDDILINYNSGENFLLREFNLNSKGNNFIFFKDGKIIKDGKLFASIDLEKYNIRRSYKSLLFEEKGKSKMQKFMNSAFSEPYKTLDISWDFDVIIYILSTHFGVNIS